MQLSKRLLEVCCMIREGHRLADVGTDHGYIPIYLVQEKVCEYAIAMDVREGPLERAKEHIRQYGLEDRIETRLSDGVEALRPQEVDCMIAAGMGGALIIHILERGAPVISEMRECILQPQSEIAKVREYLWQHDFCIAEERMVLEDGKFYPIMRVLPGVRQEIEQENRAVYAQFGPCLLQHRDPVLKKFLDKDFACKCELLEQLEEQLPIHAKRLEELREECDVLKQALQTWKEE